MTYEKGRVESSNQSKDIEEDTQVATPDTKGSLVGDQVHVYTLSLHSRSHAGVCETNGSPNEEECETGQGKEPIENGAALGRLSDVRQ